MELVSTCMMRETDSRDAPHLNLFRLARFAKVIIILHALLNNLKLAATPGVLHES